MGRASARTSVPTQCIQVHALTRVVPGGLFVQLSAPSAYMKTQVGLSEVCSAEMMPSGGYVFQFVRSVLKRSGQVPVKPAVSGSLQVFLPLISGSH